MLSKTNCMVVIKTFSLIASAILLWSIIETEKVFGCQDFQKKAHSNSADDLLIQYADYLTELQKEIRETIPKVNEEEKAAFLKARESVKEATAASIAAKQSLNKINAAKGLVDHAKGKWLGGAEKGIAKAEAALKAAVNEIQKNQAKQELAKWQADKEAGLQALKERQAAFELVKADETNLIQASKTADAELDQAQTIERDAANRFLELVKPLLSSQQLDKKLVLCAVMSEATPKGLAEFARQGKDQEDLIAILLAEADLMKQMLSAGGAPNGRYGQAMKIYRDILSASRRASTASDKVLERLALATALQHAEPVPQRNAVANKDAPTAIDPVKRYLHYEKAYFDGELDPAFKDLTVWELRLMIDSEAPDHVLAWGREMLRNYRPDHIFNTDYGWRYSGSVRTDVAYRSLNLLKDSDDLEFFQNVMREGGICGRRAFFGRFILHSFGIPCVRRPQKGHAAIAHWTPAGWVINLGAGWGSPDAKGLIGLTDADFLLETQLQKFPDEHLKSLRLEWVSAALAEPKYNGFQPGSGGFWNILAQLHKQSIVAKANPKQLAALGSELGEANETTETKAQAVSKASVKVEDKKIILDDDGSITIPAAACQGSNQLVNSFLGGQQMIFGGPLSCEILAPRAGRYQLTARVVTVHNEHQLLLTSNDSKETIEVSVPYTCGKWETTQPVEVTLVQGRNKLSFAKPLSSFGLKEFKLTPIQ